MIKYLLFTLVLAYTSQWAQLELFFSSFGQKKAPITISSDDKLQHLLQSKAGIEIESIKILESTKPFGMMVGVPSYPQLILSRNLVSSFTSDEQEYVVLHEAGHYKLYHSLTELILGLLLLAIGVVLLRNIVTFRYWLPTAIVMGILFGIMLIRLGRYNEYQADQFALRHMTNPQGMITASIKFKDYYQDSFSKSKLIRSLFYRGNPYESRIKLAEQEIEARNN